MWGRDRVGRVIVMKRSRNLTLLGTCAAALAMTPATDARAAHEVVYDVVIEGTGKFSDVKHIAPTVTDPTDFTHQVDATIGIRSEIPGVTFVDGRLDADASGPSMSSVTAKSKITAVGENGTRTQTCNSLWSLDPEAQAHITSSLLQPLEDAEPLVIRAADNLDTDYECSGDSLSADESVLGLPVEVGEGAMDAEFTIPRDIIGHGKIIQLVKGAPPFAWQKCPGQYDDLWTCTGGWEGTVTFTKVSESGRAAPAPAPQPSPSPAPAPAPAPKTDPLDDSDDLLAPLVPAKATVDRKGRTASFTATCPAGCSGTATFTSGKARAAAKARAKTLGVATFKVKAGRKQTVKVKLPAKARSALKRARKAKMTVVLKAKGGVTRRATLTLKLPRR